MAELWHAIGSCTPTRQVPLAHGAIGIYELVFTLS